MLRIAFSTLAGRKGGMLGAFAAVALAVILVVSCGILLESSLQAPIPVERLAAAGVVVQADPTFDGNASVLLSERRRLPAGARRAPARGCRASAPQSPTARSRSRSPTARAPPRRVATAPALSATAGRAPRSRRSRSRADARRARPRRSCSPADLASAARSASATGSAS